MSQILKEQLNEHISHPLMRGHLSKEIIILNVGNHYLIYRYTIICIIFFLEQIQSIAKSFNINDSSPYQNS